MLLSIWVAFSLDEPGYSSGGGVALMSEIFLLDAGILNGLLVDPCIRSILSLKMTLFYYIPRSLSLFVRTKATSGKRNRGRT